MRSPSASAGNWPTGLSPWLRTTLAGPWILALLMIQRGALFAVPIGAIYLVFFSAHRLQDMGNIAGFLGLIFAASALGGFLHHIVGRRLFRIPIVGPAFAGIAAITPYMAAISVLVRLKDGRGLLEPWDEASRVVFVALTLFFGPFFGYFVIRRLHSDDAA